MRGKRERARCSAREIEVGSIEEYPGVGDAIRTERRISDGGGANRRRREPVQIIIVTGHPLAVPSQLAAFVEPAPQPMKDDDLIPESTC